MNWELLVGLIAIAIAIFFGFGSLTKNFRDEFKDISRQLASIKEKIIEVATKFDTAWGMINARWTAGGTIQRTLPNLGKVQISASPEAKRTQYDIQVEKVVLKGGLIEKATRDSGFFNKEVELFGEPTGHMILSSHVMRLQVPSTDPKVCTQFLTEYLNWLNSTYTKALKAVDEFEEPILS